MNKVAHCLLTALLLLTTNKVYANNNSTNQEKTQEDSSADLWRIGLGLGLEYHDLEAKVKDDFSLLAFKAKSSLSQTKKLFHVAPSLEIGRTLEQDYYFGLVFSWRYLDAKEKSNAPLKDFFHITHEFQMTYFFDILAKPGYRFTPNFMAYGLIGPSIARWSHSTDLFDDNVKIDRFNFTKTSVGVGIGAGLEYLFKEKYVLSFDYIFHIHRSHTKQQIMTIEDRVPGTMPRPRARPVSKKIEPSYSTVGIRLSYFL